MRHLENECTKNPENDLFADAAPLWCFEQLAKYFGSACRRINSVYLLAENVIWGQVVLFENRSHYFFEASVNEGYISVVSLHLEGEV